MSGYNVDIQNEYSVEILPTQRIVEAVSYVLSQHDVEPDTMLTLVITNDEQVRQLNVQYRGVDAATDVLSFPAEPLPDEIDEEVPYLGDLIVAYPYTVRHTEESGHAIADELVLLAIHGTLHLLGYDHDNAQHQAKMWAAQSDALKVAGVRIDVPLFSFEDDIDA